MVKSQTKTVTNITNRKIYLEKVIKISKTNEQMKVRQSNVK